MAFNNPSYSSSAVAPPTTAQSNARQIVYIAAHYRKTAQVSTRNGLIVEVNTREV